MLQCNILENCCWWELLKTPTVCALQPLSHTGTGCLVHILTVILKFFIKQQTQESLHRDCFISWELLQVLSHVRTEITIYHFNTNPCLAQKSVQ